MAYRCAAHKKASLSGGSVGAGAGGGRGYYGGPDRISSLPDELLHHVLSFVTTPEAVRTSALSRRWVGVWKRVPRLHLLEEEATSAGHIPDHFDGILRRYAADVDIADLAISYHWDWPEVDGDRASAWAAFAARSVTGRFYLAVTTQVGHDDDAVLDLPCFERATEISLYSSGMAVRLPALDDAAAGGGFTRLTRLRMSELRFSDAGEGISGVVSRRCPSLECLELEHIDGMEALTLRSDSLLSLRLAYVPLRRLDVAAGNMRKMRVKYCFDGTSRCPWTGGAAMRLAAPALEELGWEDAYPDKVELISLPSCLMELAVVELPSHIIHEIGQSDFTKILKLFSRAHVLRLTSPMTATATLDSEEQESLIHSVQLPYYSALDLGVITNGHSSFGSSVVHFLKRNSSIRNLTLTLNPYHPKENKFAPCCMSNCTCHEPLKWWDQDIPLDSLEQLAIKHISGHREAKKLRTAAAAYVQWPAREQTPTAGAGGGGVPARPTGSEHRRLERAEEAAWSARGNCDSAAVDFVDFLSVNVRILLIYYL
uniref:F-box domain-containing protein n=1 Tax=Oryza rufipogon TaxID=4529 RepID=A0A0E0Q9L5_ORYRU